MLKNWNATVEMTETTREEWVESVVGRMQADPFKLVDYVLCGDSLVIAAKLNDQISVFDCKVRRLGRFPLVQEKTDSELCERI